MTIKIVYYGKAPTAGIRKGVAHTKKHMIKNNFKNSIYDVYDGIDVKATMNTKAGASKYMKPGRTMVAFIVK